MNGGRWGSGQWAMMSINYQSKTTCGCVEFMGTSSCFSTGEDYRLEASKYEFVTIGLDAPTVRPQPPRVTLLIYICTVKVRSQVGHGLFLYRSVVVVFRADNKARAIKLTRNIEMLSVGTYSLKLIWSMCHLSAKISGN